MQSRHTNPSVEDLIGKACFLDPRFKALSLLPEPDRKKVVAPLYLPWGGGRDLIVTQQVGDITAYHPARRELGPLFITGREA